MHPVGDNAEEEDSLQTENGYLTVNATMTGRTNHQGDEEDDWQGATDIPDEGSAHTENGYLDEGSDYIDGQNEESNPDSDKEESNCKTQVIF